jgi:exodeoxyribonuclease VII small subunit
MADAERAREAAELSFEEALQRLERLAESLDSERLDLEQSLRLYEEGVQLVRLCGERLSAAELRVRQLEPDGRGGWAERPFVEGSEE